MLQNPKNIFLLDGFGAIISAFFLGIVLVYFEAFFGIPKNTLYILALFPCIFLIYDLVCFYFLNKNLSFHLKLVSILNFLYVLLSLAMVYKDMNSITLFGYIYIISEIIILLLLVPYEWKFSAKLEGFN